MKKGLGDRDELDEQEVGELSLGATLDVDRRIAWGEDRLTYPVDAEASGTEDDIGDARLAEDD